MIKGSETVYRNSRFRVVRRTSHSKSQKSAYYLVEKKDAVAAIVYIANKFLLVRQYRPALKKHVIELPAAYVLAHGLPLLLSIFCIIVAISDFFSVTLLHRWITKEIYDLILLYIAIFGAYLIVTREEVINFFNSMLNNNLRLVHDKIEVESKNRDAQAVQVLNRFDSLERSVGDAANTIIRSVHGVKFIEFDDPAIQMRYIAGRIREARTNVDDLSWSENSALYRYNAERQESEEEYEKAIYEFAARKDYREVFVFNRQSRKEKLRARMENLQKGYSCGYFPDARLKLPRLQFMIIDDEEVIFASSAANQIRCSIVHPQAVLIFTEYYQRIWHDATKLRFGEYKDDSTIAEIIGQ